MAPFYAVRNAHQGSAGGPISPFLPEGWCRCSFQLSSFSSLSPSVQWPQLRSRVDWPKTSLNFAFTAKLVFPKSLTSLNSGSDSTRQVCFWEAPVSYLTCKAPRVVRPGAWTPQAHSYLPFPGALNQMVKRKDELSECSVAGTL